MIKKVAETLLSIYIEEHGRFHVTHTHTHTHTQREKERERERERQASPRPWRVEER